MDIDKNTQDKLQEFQIGEQNLQNLLMQKQAFQLELNETNSALEEIKNSGDEIYKITGQIMIKAKKQDVVKELQEKKNILSLREKTIEKQEKAIQEKLEKTKKELENKLKVQKK